MLLPKDPELEKLSPDEDPNARKKAVAVGVGWGVLNLLGLLAARRG